MILEVCAITSAATALFFGLILFGLEIQYRWRSEERLEITSSDWHWQIYDCEKYWLTGFLELWNCSDEFEMVVSDLRVQVEVLPKATVEPIVSQVHLLLDTGDELTHENSYWATQIVQADRSRHVKVRLQLEGVVQPDQAIWLQLHAVLYTRLGQVSQVKHLIVPIPFDPSLSVQPEKASSICPIHTPAVTPFGLVS